MIWSLFFLAIVTLFLQVFVLVIFTRVMSSVKEDLMSLAEMIQPSDDKSSDVAKKLQNRLHSYLDFSSPKNTLKDK